MVSFPPYLPSLRWYSLWLDALNNKAKEPVAIETASFSVGPRNYARAILNDFRGGSQVISIPIEGGSRLLRNPLNLEDAVLSEHGNWRKNHLRALEALYGKSPFYDHLASALTEIYLDRSLVALKDFNVAIHRLLTRFLISNLRPGDFNLLLRNPVIKLRGKEMSVGMDMETSIIGPLMKYGPETILALI